MPGNASRYPHSRRSVQSGAQRDRLYGQRKKDRRSSAAARACAARLMAPGSALELPRLAPECLDPFRPFATYSGAFTLARNLLLAGIGTPEDWERSNADPTGFMLHTIKRTAAVFDRKAIDGVAHTNIVFGTQPSVSGWREPEEQQDPNRVFVTVEATHISAVYLRETFELLAKVDPRLPATFYRVLLDAVSEWILCYDESAAEAYFDYRMECYEEARTSGEDEEGIEKPQTIEDTKGPWLAKAIQTVARATGSRSVLVCPAGFESAAYPRCGSNAAGALPRTEAHSSGLESLGRMLPTRFLHVTLHNPCVSRAGPRV